MKTNVIPDQIRRRRSRSPTPRSPIAALAGSGTAVKVAAAGPLPVHRGRRRLCLRPRHQGRELFPIVVINASDEARVTGIKNQAMHLPPSLSATGKVLRPVLTIGLGNTPDNPSLPADGPLRLPVPKSSLVIYEAVPGT